MQYRIENDLYAVAVDETGALHSLQVKPWQEELIKEPRLAAGFRINLPLPEKLDHYVEGSAQHITIRVEGSDSRIVMHCASLRSALGTFPISCTYFIDLEDERLRFSYRIENPTDYPLAEIWYPILGGLTGLGERMATECRAPGYTGELRPDVFRHFSGTALGNEDAQCELAYPGLSMPWVSLFDRRRDIGLYLAEHNELQRRVSFLFRLTPGYHESASEDNWPAPDEVDADTPVGVTFAKVAYPHTRNSTFHSGCFVVQAHRGDWHAAAKLYRRWFLDTFPFDKSGSWLRKEQAWFSSILYQPEDRVVATHRQYAEWMRDAVGLGITTGEVLGWDRGGIERDYPDYVPEEQLGGWDGYRAMVRQIHDGGARLLTFVNYQILDACTAWYRDDLHRYRRMDSFGHAENWMAWGESTLKAAVGLDVRRHVPASVSVPGFTEVLDGYLTALIAAGSDGLQIDKLCVNGQLDFNPGHERDPDLPMCEDLVQAIHLLYEKCKRLNPEVCFAGEANTDRFISYIDVFYRAATAESISTLRYVFPEWTACVHTSSPFDYTSVNGALMLGAVLVVEPCMYTRPVSHAVYRRLGRYIAECLRIRAAYLDRIFLADYLDTQGAVIEPLDDQTGEAPAYRVHAHWRDGRRAIVVVNRARRECTYRYAFTGRQPEAVTLVEPFADERTCAGSGLCTIGAERVQILLEPGEH
jgi:hypothetical protein